MKKPQRHTAGTIGDAAEHRPAPSKDDLDEFYAALHENLLARREAAYRPNLRSVLVAYRQQAQQIADRRDAEPLEPLGDSRTNPL